MTEGALQISREELHHSSLAAGRASSHTEKKDILTLLHSNNLILQGLRT